MIVKSPQAKKILADELERHNPDMLDWIKTVSGVFGQLEQVSYKGKGDKEALARLKSMRDKGQTEQMKLIKQKLR